VMLANALVSSTRAAKPACFTKDSLLSGNMQASVAAARILGVPVFRCAAYKLREADLLFRRAGRVSPWA